MTTNSKLKSFSFQASAQLCGTLARATPSTGPRRIAARDNLHAADAKRIDAKESDSKEIDAKEAEVVQM